jgi:hypothetical protein
MTAEPYHYIPPEDREPSVVARMGNGSNVQDAWAFDPTPIPADPEEIAWP